MSSVTTSKIDTRDGTTNLTLTTGNTTGASIVVNTGDSINFRSNSTFTTLTSNSTTITANVPFTFANTISATRSSTFSGNTSFTANVSTVNLYSDFTISNVATVNSNTLNLGTSSISTTGFSRLPNGLLIQWGSVTTSSTLGDITFPTAFTSLYSITSTAVGTVSGATYATTFLAANNTTANVRTANTNSRTVYWQAIGV